MPVSTWDAATVVLLTERKYVQKWIARNKPLSTHHSTVPRVSARSSRRRSALPNTAGTSRIVTMDLRYAASTSDGAVLQRTKIDAVDTQNTASQTSASARRLCRLSGAADCGAVSVISF